MSRMPVTISLNFMPAFYHRHAGLTYAESYYFDVRRRLEVERSESILLHQLFGSFGVGSADPEPSTLIFIQPIDLVKLTQGARLRCPEDATLETCGAPWSGLEPSQIAALDAAAAARHPVIDALVAQYHTLRGLVGDRADLLGLGSGLLNIHTPFTTAHQLCGEGLLLLLKDDPEGVQRIFAKIREILDAIFTRLRRETGAPPPRRIHLGDCSASLLSPADYAASVLPANQGIAAGFPEVGYHSCGRSTRLLTAFASLPHLARIELGAGTDLTAAVRAMPGVAMRPLVDPSLMRDASASQVAETVTGMLEACRAAPSTTLCAWSFDRETPVENVVAMYRTVDRWNA